MAFVPDRDETLLPITMRVRVQHLEVVNWLKEACSVQVQWFAPVEPPL